MVIPIFVICVVDVGISAGGDAPVFSSSSQAENFVLVSARSKMRFLR